MGSNAGDCKHAYSMTRGPICILCRLKELEEAHLDLIFTLFGKPKMEYLRFRKHWPEVYKAIEKIASLMRTVD